MPSFTSTSFGLIIAFLLPGGVALGGLDLLLPEAHETLKSLVGSPPTATGLAILVVVALTLGLILSGFRWAVFENWLLKDKKLDPELFSRLNDQQTSATFRVALDEGYRHHQFWGGLAFGIPLLAWGWISQHSGDIGACSLAVALALGGCILSIAGAFDAYDRFVSRAAQILQGETK